MASSRGGRPLAAAEVVVEEVEVVREKDEEEGEMEDEEEAEEGEGIGHKTKGKVERKEAGR